MLKRKKDVIFVTVLLIVGATSSLYSQTLKAGTLRIQSSSTPIAAPHVVVPAGYYGFTVDFTSIAGSSNVWMFTPQIPITGIRYDSQSDGNWKTSVSPAVGLSYVLMFAKVSPKNTKPDTEIHDSAQNSLNAAWQEDTSTEKEANIRSTATKVVDDLTNTDYTATPTLFVGIGATVGALTDSQNEASGSLTLGPYVGVWKFTLLAGYDVLQKQYVIQFGTQIDSFDVSLGDSPLTVPISQVGKKTSVQFNFPTTAAGAK
jgi:hypothetical protein